MRGLSEAQHDAGVFGAVRPLLPILSRAAAAILGGYCVAAAASVALALSLPLARIDAVLIGLLLSFAIYAAAILWAFAARTPQRAWVGLLIPAIILSVPVCLAVWARAA